MTHLPAALLGEPESSAPTRMRFRISASQLKMFHPDAGGCPRKWAMHYLAHVPRLPGDALTEGIRAHECIAQFLSGPREDWERAWPLFVRLGADRDQDARAKTAALALAMAEHVPAGTMPPIVEGTDMLEVPELDTAFYIKPDWARREAAGGSVFVDWKTTGSVSPTSEWVLQDRAWYADGRTIPATAKFLEDDIQARLYAYGLMQLWHEVRIKARWVYGSKRFDLGQRPKVWIVEHTFHRPETRAWVEKHVWPTVRTMNTIRAAFEAGALDSPLLVPHHGDACGFTGRFCDALGHCGFQQSPISMGKLALTVLPGSH
jgi:hypothetical protein